MLLLTFRVGFSPQLMQLRNFRITFHRLQPKPYIATNKAFTRIPQEVATNYNLAVVGGALEARPDSRPAHCLLPDPSTGCHETDNSSNQSAVSCTSPLFRRAAASVRAQRVDVPAGPALQPRPSPAGLDRGAGSAGQRAARAAEEVGCFPEPCGAARKGSGLAGLPTPGQGHAPCGCKSGGVR